MDTSRVAFLIFCLRKKEVKTRLAANVIDFNESNALIYFK